MNHLVVPTMMFEERSEQVWFMPSELTQTFVDRVAAQLEPDVHQRKDAAQDVATLYFDSDTRALARASANGEGVRLRAREYYDRSPHAGQRQHPALVWFEIKTREGGHTRKLRHAIPTIDVPAYLHDGTLDVEVLRRPTWSGSPDDVQRAVSELLVHTREPLRPDCVANYRRRAWQDTHVRITVDTELAFHRPPIDPFADGQPLHAALIEPVASVRESLVEIKLRAPQPKWLRELIDELGLRLETREQRSFSKFTAASRAVHR